MSLDEISNDWLKTNAPLHIKRLAEYYGIYKHLFGDAFFTPYVQMDISYEYNSKTIPVYRGNVIKPKEVLLKILFINIKVLFIYIYIIKFCFDRL